MRHPFFTPFDTPFESPFTPEEMATVVNAAHHGLTAFTRYAEAFWHPYVLATGYFREVESKKLPQHTVPDNLSDYMTLGMYNLDLVNRALDGILRGWNGFQRKMGDEAVAAFAQLLRDGDPQGVQNQALRLAKLMTVMAVNYPEAVNAIEPEYGFHFERGDTTRKVEETDRFIMYQVLPTEAGVSVRQDGKPVLILPPYVLGANILGFLPGERRSYAHSFANQGVPTYIRILKDIRVAEALQVMTGEDDANDTRRFCETLKQRHGAAVTLNGYCQGGFSALSNLLSGSLDNLVDAFITCVAPMDGTRSQGLSDFLKALPQRFNQLSYGTKTLANGNQVADGQLMGWVYKLKSIEEEFPVSAFFRDLMMFAAQKGPDVVISKTAAALNYWLSYERFDLPLEITRMSFASFTTPIDKDGNLPVKLFDRPLNLKRLTEKKIPWLICYGLHDNLVEPASALAPLDWVDAEVAAFPKGHVAMATSWSHPESACALHTRFGENKYRGPVRFHLDLEASRVKEVSGKRRQAAKAAGGGRKKTAAVAGKASTKKRVPPKKAT